MTKRPNKGEEIAAITASMGDLVAEAGTILQMVSRAFRRSRLEEIREIGPGSSRACITGSGLINSVLELGHAGDGEKRALIGAIGDLERICACSTELADRIRSKIEQDILFSIQAFGECNELFTVVIGTVGSLGKLLRGEVEQAEVEGRCRRLERLIYDSGRGHEERLIKGVCAIKASDLFISMLDLFRAISFHSSQAAESVERCSAG